ncbi:MAG: aminotransferase class I/II-fold pyridoxal phosphate-dependent enzyme [Patescibacteria group bacterium]
MLNKYLKKSIQNLIPYTWEDTTEQIAKKNNLKPAQIIRLDYNTPASPPDCYDDFIKVISKKRDVNEYLDFDYEKLKILIAKYENCKTNQVVCGNSGDEMIDIIAKCCLNYNDRFIISSPTYSVYKIQSELVSGKVQDIPLDKNWQIDDKKIIAKSKNKNVKLIFICNPNNPTGTISEPKKIENIIKKANALVVVDEAYGEFYGKSFKKLINKYNNLIILKSFSKFARIASARVGYVLTNQELATKLDGIRFPMGIPYFSMELAKMVLKKDLENIYKTIKQTISERERIKNILLNNNIKFADSQANFLLIQLDKNSKPVIKKLAKKGIIVRDRNSQIKNSIRVTVRDKKTNNLFLNELIKNLWKK